MPLVHGRRATGNLKWRGGRPGWVREVHPPAAGEGVAAALGDGVDDAAAEPAELGRNAGRQDLRLLNGILDEQILGRAEQVVVDVDAVEHEDVIEWEGTVDDDLRGVRCVLRQAR